MWNPNLQTVNYSCECGNKNLPCLKELAGDRPDIHKEIILEYLKENCFCACGGIVQDIISPDKTIGYGHCFCDDRFIWDDCFIHYVERYNIPVPEEFRTYILDNYERRKCRHFQLKLIDCVKVRNNPYLGYQYEVSIKKSGLIHYKNNCDCLEGAMKMIKSQDGDWIIHEIMKQLFCYDVKERGKRKIDGYFWEVCFFRDGTCCYQTEGMSGEPDWRYEHMKQNIEFIERCIQKDMGSAYMVTR